MRERWFSRRAFLLHFLLVTVVPGCLAAGWWQVHRALSGNLLSYLYSIEWPFFAVLGVVAWWQLVHDEPVAHWVEREQAPEGRRRSWLYHQDDSEGQAVARYETLESPELSAYNRYLESLATGKAKKTWSNPRGLPPDMLGADRLGADRLGAEVEGELPGAGRGAAIS